MQTFITFLLRQRWFVLAATAAALHRRRVGLDAAADRRLPRRHQRPGHDPDRGAGLSAADVEQQVTYPIEQQMGGVPQVTQVRSLSKAGLSQVIVVFEDDMDIYFARQLVFERLQAAQGAAARPASEPELGPISTGLGEIFQYTLESDDALADGAAHASRTGSSRRSCEPIPGVNEVNSFGGFVKQYHVLVRPGRAAQVRPHACGTSWRRWRATTPTPPAASSCAAGSRPTSAASGSSPGIEDIEKVVLKADDGTPVLRARRGRRRRSARRPARARSPATARARPSPAWSSCCGGRTPRTWSTRVKETDPADPEEPAAGRRAQRLLRPHRADRGLHQDRRRRPARGRHLRDPGPLPLPGRAAHRADRGRSRCRSPSSSPSCHGPGRASPSNLMSLGGLAFSVGMVVDASIVIVENIRRHFGERRDAGAAAAHRHRGGGRGGAAGGLLGADHRASSWCRSSRLQGIEGKMFAPLARDDVLRDPGLAGRGADHRPGALRVAPAAGARRRSSASSARFHHGYLRAARPAPGGAPG